VGVRVWDSCDVTRKRRVRAMGEEGWDVNLFIRFSVEKEKQSVLFPSLN